MTQEVIDLVLKDNYDQALAMSIANFYSSQLISTYMNYIREFEATGVIDRKAESLPSDREMLQRKSAGIGLTSPELAILLAYTKIHIKKEMLNNEFSDNIYLKQIFYTAFPPTLQQKFPNELTKHSLYREILATQLSNLIVNKTGIVFVYNLQNETGATIIEIICAFLTASHVFNTLELQQVVESFDNKLSSSLQYEFFGHIYRLINQATRWFLHRKTLITDHMEETIDYFAKCARTLKEVIPSLMQSFIEHYYESLSIEFSIAGISLETARSLIATRIIYPSLSIGEIARTLQFDLIKTAKIYFSIGEKFRFSWFRDLIAGDMREGYWESLTRKTLRDELDNLQTQITIRVIKHNSKTDEPQEMVQKWIDDNIHIMERWNKDLEMLSSNTTLDYSTFFITLRELFYMIQS